ncbi:hypothetical protein BDQ17DRAFT_1330723 [Cyathus striatus]|nr:hypothetical protein BDQ17DRAFT_1330723 [Cyathus striatus]
MSLRRLNTVAHGVVERLSLLDRTMALGELMRMQLIPVHLQRKQQLLIDLQSFTSSSQLRFQTDEPPSNYPPIRKYIECPCSAQAWGGGGEGEVVLAEGRAEIVIGGSSRCGGRVGARKVKFDATSSQAAPRTNPHRTLAVNSIRLMFSSKVTPKEGCDKRICVVLLLASSSADSPQSTRITDPRTAKRRSRLFFARGCR